MTRGAWLRWLLGLIVSGVFIWLVFRGIDLQEVGRTIAGARQVFLPAVVAGNMAALILRVARWQLCFEPADGVTFAQALSGYSLGSASGQVIPARLGDLVRVYVLGQTSRVSKSKALGTLVVERLSDLFAVVILLALLLPLFSLPGQIEAADRFAAAVAVLALVVVYLLARRGSALTPPAWVAKRPLARKLFALFVQLLAGFSAVKDARRALVILLASFAIWILQIAAYLAAFAALPNLPPGLGWQQAGLLTCLLALTAIIPAGPGFAGTFEAAAMGILGLFAVDPAVAIGYLEYTRIATLIALLIFAGIGLAALKLARRPASSGMAAPGRQPTSLQSPAVD